VPITPGTHLGSYEILSPLGSGGMGQVWRARHRMLGRPAAIKLIRPKSLGSEGSEADGRAQILLRRFEREAKATSALQSPHTVRVYDFGTTDDGTFYYVMELLEGRDLHSLVEQHGPLPAARVIYILRQVCESLAEAHRNGLIHRDIKPANIFLTESSFKYDFVKVLDFGLVKHAPGSERKDTKLTVDGVVAGSPAFMAPELIQGATPTDERVDIYSAGCVAYWLLTGQLVFEGDTPLQILMAHLEQQPDPPSSRSELEIPAELERVVLACLEKNPEKRPQSVETLSGQLAACPVEEPWTEGRAERWWQTHHPPKAPGEDITDQKGALAWDITAKPGPGAEGGAKQAENGPQPKTASAASTDPPSEAELERDFTLPRGSARALFLVTQVGYLAMYCAALYQVEVLDQALDRILTGSAGITTPLVIVSAMCGIAVRLYLLMSVGLDHPATGLKFRRLFPVLLVLDSLWAASPMLLAQKIGNGMALASVAALAYLPFAQRTLIQSVYPGAKPAGSWTTRL